VAQGCQQVGKAGAIGSSKYKKIKLKKKRGAREEALKYRRCQAR